LKIKQFFLDLTFRPAIEERLVSPAGPRRRAQRGEQAGISACKIVTEWPGRCAAR
jgi:hypothetical protein